MGIRVMNKLIVSIIWCYILLQTDLVLGSSTVDERIERIVNNVLPGMEIEGRDIVTTRLDNLMRNRNVPGLSVAVINDGEIEWARGFGVADVERQIPVTSDTLFQAASISKPIAAMVALDLVEEGKLALDGDVNNWLKSWKVGNSEFTETTPITLRGLLTHTAGLNVHGFPGYQAGTKFPTTVGVLSGKGNTDAVMPIFNPREKYKYSGGGYTIMQLMVEDITGKSFTKAAYDRVLKPLGMEGSGYHQPLPEHLQGRAAIGYKEDGTPLTGKYHTYPEKAAAGLWTTPTELARYLISVQKARQSGNHSVLSSKMIDEMLNADIGDHGLGPGLEDGGRRFGHGGSNQGFKCYMTAFADEGKGGVVMTNGDNGYGIAMRLMITISHEYGWASPRMDKREVVTLEERDYTAIAGKYRRESGEMKIEYQDAALRLIVLGQPEQSYELMPLSRTHFVARERGPHVFIRWNDDSTVQSARVARDNYQRVD